MKDIEQTILDEANKLSKLNHIRESGEFEDREVSSISKEEVHENAQSLKETYQFSKKIAEKSKGITANIFEGLSKLCEHIWKGAEEKSLKVEEVIGFTENAETILDEAIEEQSQLNEMIKDDMEGIESTDIADMDVEHSKPIKPYIQDLENNSQVAQKLAKKSEDILMKDDLKEFSESCQKRVEEAREGKYTEEQIQKIAAQSNKTLANAIEEMTV